MLQRTLLLGFGAALAGCGAQNPVMTPVGWWHDLQGGEIAATRPPPPGAHDPYPKLGTVPPKPVLPGSGLRNTVRDQLATERDTAERIAARTPISTLPPPPPPPPPAQTVSAGSETANATLPAAETPPAPAKPAAADAPQPLIIAGTPEDPSGLPAIPASPPAPASFETVQAQPAPSPMPAPRGAITAAGDQVLFATGSAVLDASQGETLGGAVARRGHGRIDVEGHGEAISDSPAGQEAALGLALQRASVIAAALEKRGVPEKSIILSATAFGRGAALRIVP